MDNKRVAKELVRLAKDLQGYDRQEYDRVVGKAIRDIGTYAHKNISASSSRQVSEYLRRISLIFEEDKVFNMISN